jgi:hypothetical protein
MHHQPSLPSPKHDPQKHQNFSGPWVATPNDRPDTNARNNPNQAADQSRDRVLSAYSILRKCVNFPTSSHPSQPECPIIFLIRSFPLAVLSRRAGCSSTSLLRNRGISWCPVSRERERRAVTNAHCDAVSKCFRGALGEVGWDGAVTALTGDWDQRT